MGRNVRRTGAKMTALRILLSSRLETAYGV